METTITTYDTRTQIDAKSHLLRILKPGDTIYTILRHVSATGMSRSITTIVVTPDGPFDITWLVAKLLDRRRDEKHDGVIVKGCGMDMGFDLVYSLSARLYGYDHEGGYALKHKWL